MPTITIQLLQTPQILLDGHPITLPFKKAEGLLYYMAIKKTIPREQAASLLWAENDEATAKKNLRNSLYTIKKAFQLEPIISPQRQILTLNPELIFDIDYDRFVNDQSLEVYAEELLPGFYVKNAEEFENWLASERASLKDLFLHKLYRHMTHTPYEQVSLLEADFFRYTKEDPLDERAYYLMMKVYQHNQLYHKGIKVYQNLSKLLNSELRITPNQDIANLHKELLNAWTESTSAEETTAAVKIDGRDREIQFLTKSYHKFLSGTPTAILLAGENGVGKTYLMNHFLDMVDYESCLVLRSVCFQAEREFLFQPWNSIMMQLDQYISQENIQVPQRYLSTIASIFPLFGNQTMPSHLPEDINVSYNYRAARNSVLKLFSVISENIPVILSFDNLQFMDSLSLELLSLIIRQQNSNVMILCTCSDMVPAHTQKFLSAVIKEKFAAQLTVEPFSRKDVYAFIRNRLGEDALSETMMDMIYQRTEGNAFFLEILLSNFRRQNQDEIISLHSQDILTDRIAELSKDSRQILDLISLFHDHATLEILEYILNRDTLEILDLLDDLKQHGLIEEKVVGTKIHFQFRHHTMQDFVHSQLAPSKRRILHQRVAAYLEQSPLPRTGAWYQQVIYHYTLCGNEPKVLMYKVLELEAFSNFNFDLYPILNAQVDTSVNMDSTLRDTFEELTDKLYRLSHLQPDAIDYSEIEARLMHISGKYYISQGNYPEGVAAIRKVLSSNAYVKSHPHMQIQCLRQMTFYGIQIWDTELMEEYIIEGTQLALENNFSTEYAIDCRLYGLLCSMKGEYIQAQDYLMKSIELFKSSPLKAQSYAMNIAACYNYLGEVQRKQKNFRLSLTFYDKAISTYTSRNCPASATFYTNKARALIALKDRDACREILEIACKLYDDSSLLMGRSIAKGYMAILYSLEKNWKEAVSSLADAMECAKKLSSPLESGLLACTQMTLCRKYPEHFKGLLDTPEKYRDIMESCLKDLPGAYEYEDFHWGDKLNG